MSTLLTYQGERDACRVQLYTDMHSPPEQRDLLLDIDYFLAKSQGIAPQESLEWLEYAHQQISVIFESCITDELRQLFGEVV